MASCTCPTCGQSISTDKLFISKCRTYAARGDEIVKLSFTEGAILYVMRNGKTMHCDSIRTQVERGTSHGQKPLTRGSFDIHLWQLRQRIEPLGLKIINVDREYRLIASA